MKRIASLMALVVAMLLLTSMQTVVKANDNVDGQSQQQVDPSVGQASQANKDQAEKDAAVAQQKLERKRAAKQKKRTMESCLTLVRGYYYGQDQQVQDFVQEHPTLDKQRLLSKILSQMMIMCNGSINASQIEYLQDFRLNASNTDYSRTDLAELINIDWEELKFRPAGGELMEGEGQEQVDMTSQEIMMSNEVEEYSDELKRESDLEARDAIGKTTIAFIDIENMGALSKVMWLAVISALFGGIGYFFYKELFACEPDVNDIRKEVLKMRKEGKKSK